MARAEVYDFIEDGVSAGKATVDQQSNTSKEQREALINTFKPLGDGLWIGQALNAYTPRYAELMRMSQNIIQLLDNLSKQLKGAADKVAQNMAAIDSVTNG
jgi:WXG100 family type VII secretion target